MDGIRLLLNIVWLVLHGWALALAYLLAGVILYVAILAIALGFLVPRLERARRGEPVRSQLVAGGAVIATLTLATTALMELKPG